MRSATHQFLKTTLEDSPRHRDLFHDLLYGDTVARFCADQSQRRDDVRIVDCKYIGGLSSLYTERWNQTWMIADVLARHHAIQQRSGLEARLP